MARLARRLVLAAAMVLAVLWPAAADIARHFDGIDGAFVVRNGATGETIRHDPAHAATRFAPCSTFKIPNTAILIETGAARDLDHSLPYDPALGLNNPDWARDQTLRSAFNVSALWYYRAMARKAGIDAVSAMLAHLDYGNGQTGGSIGQVPFWVDGTLLISPDEQVDFLARLHEGRLVLSDRAMRLTREAMVAEETPRWRLSAKTGACRPGGGKVSLWYVGTVERDGTAHHFALHMTDTGYDRLMARRIPVARAILADLGILD